ncbi:hypothetical protein HPP92_013606 [Vanilla planifolia]|uniref:J domain-containing protein n=1 Tax=Vanilla planifolia TaxID=51239 RepID=A0A835QNR4_VANPL|nr:hypothetical protein HPP92_013606 [Vanilla planifolia]
MMDCNRDEALRAKELAERKFTEKDYVCSKKFALKAQNLFPSLEGISQMLTALDVYLASEAKVNGEKDLYAVLHVNASADEETVKKQYRKLALLLHPDKNKCTGAEGAFQLVSEAWNVLSDRSKKIVYDQKISVKGFHQSTSQPGRNTTVPTAASNGFYKFATSAAAKVRTQPRDSYRPPSVMPPPSHHPPQTFWTSCAGCCMQYEYHKMYLNKPLLCPKCKQPFLATELPDPPVGFGLQWPSKQQNLNGKYKNVTKNTSASLRMRATGFQHVQDFDTSIRPNFQWIPFSASATADDVNNSSATSAHGANVVHQAYEKVKRRREEARAAARTKETICRRLLQRTASFSNLNTGFTADNCSNRREGTGDDTRNNYAGVQMNSSGGSSINFVPGMDKDTGFYVDPQKPKLSLRSNSFQREYAQVDIGALLMEKAKVGILKKLEEINSAETSKSKVLGSLMKKQKSKDDKERKMVYKQNAKKTFDQDFPHMKVAEDSVGNCLEVPNEEVCQMDVFDDTIKEVNQPLSINVPDPDFHDFDNDRTEKAFGSDQVWATYDDDDGMPRYYAFIQKVISSKPFKVRMSFLAAKSNAEFSSLHWVGNGFTKTCGDFRVGRYVVINTINIFSHRVKWEKGFRGVIKVFPRKGDTWALYKDWSSSWDEHTPNDVVHQYEMVEALEDYNEDEGISVIPLVKVAGFKTVFLRHMDPTRSKKIPKEEMFRFSHQVPSYLLTGEEARNAPKDCLELDPAATPLELLQVLTETKDEGNINATEKLVS